MPDWVSHVSQFTVFLSLSATGFLLLVVALLFGEVFEHLDGSADHDFGHGGPSFFSVRIISVFITAFGGFGAVATHYGFGALQSSGVGFLSGATFAGLIYAFASFLYQQQASTDIHPRDVVGQVARVVVPIPKDGMGQVRCQVGEQLLDKIARTRDGAPIAENAIVTVTDILGEAVIVEPAKPKVE
jgi:membrane protein implicated in regulation of membrane protease activity